MNKIIQIFGLIFNIYLVFLLISKNNNININNNLNNTPLPLTFFNRITSNWVLHTSKDTNRLKILNRIGILLLICYSLFEIDTIKSLGSIDLSIKDGIYKITTLKSMIILFIICVAIIILMVIKNYNDAMNNQTPSE
jgi:cytochrome bd-type quinol oxidase subunit 2